ncbi:hypothetical protein EST38_g5944 [Candolleomyces aberdarensis]|uniref:Nephrocystin 3-like N-terminal domain-containing protein n=1 Tax=Candolleomyces aberdarensis TaxID=2316362 RepID=A0A4Q2DKZ6_9AGAR|nr:hypothetical protein EST38_g5944 [Candolleomyces aberdarensis]
MAGSEPGGQDRRPPQSRSAWSPYEDPASPGGNDGTISFLSGASNFRMGDIHFNVNTRHGAAVTDDELMEGWALLVRNAAPNALYDSRARYDAPKCDEDTRVELTNELVEWMKDRDGPQRLMIMTGAAGAGKSALQQTIAEICGKGDILASSYFFSSTDGSRNTVNAFIPTMAYQLWRRDLDLRRWINGIVDAQPLIFSQSLQTQMDTLIVGPLRHFREMEANMNLDLDSLPYAILIDGLDECKGEDCQAELLAAIRHSLLADDLPFRIFIASRPEWAIRTALAPGGDLHALAYHIQLSDHYDATEDMRRYLRRRFQDIGLRIGNSQWFTEGNIDTLVRAGSGQFIYVATVFKYISERRASPVHRLKTVLNWTPHEGQAARPFETLDILYASILSAAKEAYEAVDTHSGRNFCLLFKIYHFAAAESLFLRQWSSFLLDTLTSVLGLEDDGAEILFSDLRSLVALERDGEGQLVLRHYHKSFPDFLNQRSRAKDLFVPQACVRAHLAKSCMQRIVECPLTFDSRT